MSFSIILCNETNALRPNLEREFSALPEKYIEKIEKIDRLKQLIPIDKTNPKIFEFNLEKNRFYIIRFEGKYCSSYCLTAFFMNDISNA